MIYMASHLQNTPLSCMLQPAILHRSLKAPHIVPAAVLQRPHEAARAATLHVCSLLRSLKSFHLLADAAAKVVVWPCTCNSIGVDCPNRIILPSIRHMGASYGH